MMKDKEETKRWMDKEEKEGKERNTKKCKGRKMDKKMKKKKERKTLLIRIGKCSCYSSTHKHKLTHKTVQVNNLNIQRCRIKIIK